MRRRTATLTRIPGVDGKRTTTEPGAVFRSLVPPLLTVGESTKRAADHRPLVGAKADGNRGRRVLVDRQAEVVGVVEGETGQLRRDLEQVAFFSEEFHVA